MFGFAIVKKECVFGGQFSRNREWVRQKGRDPAEMPLAIESLKIWRSLERSHGIETAFRRTGTTYLCRTAGETIKVEKREGTGEAPGLLTPSVGRAEPSPAAPALASKARKFGAALPEVCTVRGFETAGGMVSGAVTGFGNIGAVPSWLREVPGRARSRGLSVHEFRGCGYPQRRRGWTGRKTQRKCLSAVVATRFAGYSMSDRPLPSETPTSHFSFRSA